MPDSDPTSHSGPHTSPDHELTGMESFFDNLFNHHMVVPQPSGDLHPSDAADADAGHPGEGENPGATPV